MRNGEFKVVWLLVSLITALGIFLGAYYLYNRLGVEKPIINQLSALNSVEKVELEKKDKVTSLEVKLKKVSNLQDVYNQIDKIISENYKKQEYKIKIIDNRNKELQETHYSIQPAVYEAIAGNKYIWLEGEIRQRIDSSANYKIFLDDKRLYLQVEMGEYQLYEVFDRNVPVQNVS